MPIFEMPRNITFQWHINDNCNLRCAHCYQTAYQDKGLSLNELLGFYGQLEAFALVCREQHPAFRGHINITGGEPFLKEELLDLLAFIRHRSVFSFAVLSNGFLLPDAGLLRLRDLRPRFVQLSLEGGKQANDAVRGAGAYAQTLKALRTYRRLGIETMISFTANSKNYQHFPEVVRIARRSGAQQVWTDRYLPSSPEDRLALSPAQAFEYFGIISKAKQARFPALFSRTKIGSNRALQFLQCGGQPYRCSAGRTLLAILPQGGILPCRRLLIEIGSLRDNPLIEIYQNSPILQQLRNNAPTGSSCQGCYYGTSCNGGLKCLSFALHGTWEGKDPHCPLHV